MYLISEYGSFEMNLKFSKKKKKNVQNSKQNLVDLNYMAPTDYPVN